MKHAKRITRLSAGVAITAMSVIGLTGATAAQDGGGLLLEEIIVTAQKRVQNLQEVPASVSVLSAYDLATRPAANIEGLQALVPTLNFRKGGTSLNSSLFLRGVGTINFSVAAEPSVAFVLDGVVLARAGEAFGDLYDIERIEVLRGPQGTLFGKNSSAGVVNVISKKPGDTFGGQVDLSVYEGGEYKSKVAVDAPLSPTLRSRITAFAGTYRGNITNLYTPSPNERPSKINGYDRKGIRGILDWDASENLAVTFIADYRESSDDCCGEVIGTAPTGATGAALNGLLAGIDFKGDATRQVRNDLVTQTDEESWGASMQADYDLSDHTITSITAFRRWDNREIREGDWLDRAAAYVGNGFAQLHDDGPQESKTFSQELRLTSPGGEAFEYVAGLYYYYAESDRSFRRDVRACTASTLVVDATGQRPCVTGASTYAQDFSIATFGSEIENMAAFVNGTYRVTDQFSLIGGLRYTQDDLSFYHVRVPARTAGLPGIRTDATNLTGQTDKDNVSGKAGVQYQANDDVMVYGSFTRGYKGPAYNVFFNMTASQQNVIAAETVDAYEVGAKTEWFDRQLTVNMSGFYAAYDNFQANSFDVLNGVVITRLTNAGEISTKGVEVDWLLRATQDFTLSGGVAYTDAQIEKFRDATGALSSARKGETLALAPKWKATAAMDYVLSDKMPVDVYFNARYSTTSSQYSDLGVNPLLKLDGYSTVDASIGFADSEDRYRLTFYVNNLFDESFASLITTGGPGGSLRYLIPREADRFFGASARIRFGG